MNEADRTASRADLLPNDTYDAKLLANTRPGGWKNPQPAPSYNLVVLGACALLLVAVVLGGASGYEVTKVEFSEEDVDKQLQNLLAHHG